MNMHGNALKIITEWDKLFARRETMPLPVYTLLLTSAEVRPVALEFGYSGLK